MQVMPPTGKELNVGDITKVDANIHAGVKYMRFMMDQYFKDEPMDNLNKGLMTFASYNAGPGRVRQLRRETEKRGLDPNVWFGNVERVASERIGRETVTYVSNIYPHAPTTRRAPGETRDRQEGRTPENANEHEDRDRQGPPTPPQGAPNAPQPLSAVGLMLRVTRAHGAPPPPLSDKKPQVANLIKNVENGVDEFRNYLEKRATTPATPPRSMREDIRGALAGHT